MQVRIEPKSDDFLRGKRYQCGACPLWFAFKRALPGASLVSVGSFHVILRAGRRDRPFWIALPYAATWMVTEFDAGRTPNPEAFEVEIPNVEVNGLLQWRKEP